jgi:integrase
MTFDKQWESGKNVANIKIYMRDILNYFSPDITLEDMQTPEHYNGFVKFMQKTIEERPSNNLATFNNRSTNHRLSVLRETFREAIARRLMEQSKLLNPDLRVKDMGWSNLHVIESKSKKPISREDEAKVMDLAYANNDEEHADAMQFKINGLGMRLQFEFYDPKFNIDCIDYKNKTINFFRHKTQQWSGDLPLNDIAYRICVKYRETAIAHKSRKLFPNVTVRSMRTFFDKYGRLLEIKDFTPYATKHTFITRLCETKTPVKVISKLAGISIETVLKYYAQETPEALREAVNSINDSNIIPLMGHNSKGLIK